MRPPRRRASQPLPPRSGKTWPQGSFGGEVAFCAGPLYGSHPKLTRRCAVSVTQQQVLDVLGKVKSPDGVALTHANVLSAVTVNDGKVFFSINVDAAQARAWESVRAETEAAVRSVP